MARVIRLPDGRKFRPEPLVKDATQLGMGNKGAFDFSETVKLLDQVAESKGIGAVANLIEKGYDAIRGDVKRPGEEKQTADAGPADALTQAAKARVKPAGERRPAATGMRRVGKRTADTSLPRQPTPDPRFPTPDPNRGPLFPANQEARRQAMLRQPPGEAQRQAVRELDDATFDVPSAELAERERRIRENIAFIQQQDAQRRAGVGAASTQPGMPAPGPAQPAPPQPPPPQFAPVPTQPAPGMIGGGAPIQGPATPMAQAQRAATQVAANIGQEARRTQPVPAAGIDLSQYQSPTGKARNSIQFFSEMADELGKRGIGQVGTQAALEIPYTVSVDELYGFARNARTLDNQKKVLDALANNRVTGMGFETLADRLSGRYRQRYLKNIVSLFPRIPQQPNLIDAISKVGRAYSAEQLGRLRAGDIAAGLPGARAMKTRAQAGRAAAGAQRAAEQAVTERELRASRAQNILSTGVSRIYNAAIKKAKKGRRGKKRRKINLREFRAATTDSFTKEQDRISAQLNKIDAEIVKAQGEAALASTPKPKASEKMIAKNIAGAKLEARRKGLQAVAKLAELQRQRQRLQTLFDGLAEKRTAYDTLHARMATGDIPSQAEFEAAGISAQQALQIIQGYRGIRSRRRQTPRRQTPPRQTPPQGNTTPTAEDVFQ